MQSYYQIEVCRASDHATVAQTMSREIRSYFDQQAAKADAKRLSLVYGPGFYVEVWTHYTYDGGHDYHRAYVMTAGRTTCAVGF